MKTEVLVDALADWREDVGPETQRKLAHVKAEALVDGLADILAELATETAGNTLDEWMKYRLGH